MSNDFGFRGSTAVGNGYYGGGGAGSNYNGRNSASTAAVNGYNRYVLIEGKYDLIVYTIVT